MDIMDRIRNAIEKGIEVSKDFVSKASEGARDLGEQGVLRIEILQLEAELKSVFSKLGSATYETLVVQDQDSIGRDDEKIQSLLSEIRALEKDIELREERLKDKP